MQVQLLRAPSGDVVCLETTSEFVDVLISVLRAPMGSVLKACGGGGSSDDEAQHPLLSLASSLPCLRDAVFETEKAQVLPGKMSFVDVANGVITLEPPKLQSAAHLCVVCLKNKAKKITYTMGTCSSCQCSTAHWCSGYILAWQYCAKCAASGASNTMAVGTCTRCSSQSVRSCTRCGWCDVCAINELGFCVADMPSKLPTHHTEKKAIKDSAKFMVTNKLEVFEASPVKMVELMPGRVDSLSGIKTCTVTVKPAHIKNLVLRSLLGSEAVLTEAFPLGDGATDFEVGSNTGTNGSVLLLSD